MKFKKDIINLFVTKKKVLKFKFNFYIWDPKNNKYKDESALIEIKLKIRKN